MNKMYISIFSFAFKILIPLNWEFFYVNVFKLECCHTYFLTFKPHLKHKGNFNTYMTELNNVNEWLSKRSEASLHRVWVFFSNIYHSLCKYHGKQVFKENSTFSVNFSATYFTDHIRFFLKSQRAKGKIKETHTEEYRSWKWWQKFQINLVTE